VTDWPVLQWSDLPAERQERAITAANDLIERIRDYAAVDGAPLTEWDLWMLRHGPQDLVGRVEEFASDGRTASELADFEATQQRAFGDTFNRAVQLVRIAINRDKAAGTMPPLVTPRPDLRIPSWWEDRYQIVYTSEIPWLISAAIQSAFMGHPPFGEKRPWRSK